MLKKTTSLRKQLFIVTSLYAVFISVDSYAQTYNAIINKIRKTVEQINKDTGYITKTLDNEQFLQQTTDGGGQLTGYFKNGKLVKIVEFIGLSSCVNITDYYFKESKLIFVYVTGKEFLYVYSLSTFNSNIQSVTMEYRFYFNNEKMVKKILKGQTRCSGQLGANWSTDFIAETNRYKNLLSK